MKAKTSLCLLVTGSLLLAAFALKATAQTIVTKSENFDSAASAIANGWWEMGTRVSPQDYGFSATSFSGAGGAAGGMITRDPTRTSYADVFGGGAALTLNNVISAKGKFILTDPPASGNPSVVYGHTDSTKVGQSSMQANVMGLVLALSPPRFFAHITLSDNTTIENTFYNPISANTVYDWEYNWNPAGGTNGGGLLTVSATDGVTTNTGVVDLTAAQRAVGASFDAFGITSRALSLQSPAPVSTNYIDSVQYTAISTSAPPCIVVGPSSLTVDLTLTNGAACQVSIPPRLNLMNSFTVTLSSSAPSVCKPAGTTGSTNIVFAAGGPTTAVIPLTVGPSDGQATLTFGNTNGNCFTSNGKIVVSATRANVNAKLKFESFDSAFSAATNGWQELGSRLNGQNYGFSATSFAGGPAGEAGGVNKRDTIRAVYGDVWDSATYGTLNLSGQLMATGTVVWQGVNSGNPGTLIGYNNSQKVGQSGEQNFLGLMISSSGRLDLYIFFADAANASQQGLISAMVPGRPYGFTFSWDPSLGANGGGLLTANVVDSFDGTTYTGTVDITPTQRAKTAIFDCFGIGNRSLSSGSNFSTNYIDSVYYTALPGAPCGITAAASYNAMVPSQTNNFFTVTVPATIDPSIPLSVNIVSTNPSVVVPQYSTVSFPAGRTYFSTNVPLTALAAGTTKLYIANASSPACISTLLSNSVISVSCGQATLTPATLSVLQGQTDQFVTVGISKGLNDPNDVSVSLTSSDPSVATPLYSTVTFPRGGYNSTNVPIALGSVGVTRFALQNLVGAGCATNNATPSTITVNCNPITLSPNAMVMLGSQTGKVVAVSMPASLNALSPVTVELQSANPAVAVPQGADAGGKLALSFPAGTTNTLYVPIVALSQGSATLFLANNSSTYCSSVTNNATLTVTVAAPGASSSKAEAFETEVAAAANGWVNYSNRVNGHNFGFTGTANAGGAAPGEAGGYINRYNARAYYADTNCGLLTLNDSIRARGKFVLLTPPVNNDVVIGHFYSGNVPASNNRNLLGFSIADPQVPPRLGAFLYNSAASGSEVLAVNPGEEIFSALYPYDWSYVYDPAGGPTGDGQLVVSFTNNWTYGVLTRTVNLTAAQRLTGAVFDSFGIIQRGLSTSSNLTELYIDDVAYTIGGPVTIQKIESAPGNQVNVTFKSYGSAHAVLQASSLTAPVSWSPVTGVSFSAAGTSWSARFAQPAGNRFYRIIANPSP